MSEPTDINERSVGIQPIPALVDPQVSTLARVLGANVRFALKEALGAEKWLENPCVDWHPWPVSLGLLSDMRLPAISCWRTQTLTVNRKKRKERRATFAIRYWLNGTSVDWLPKTWPALQAAYEVIARTLVGDGLVDIISPGPEGTHRVPSTELLALAGFLSIDEATIRGAADFVQGAGLVYPVLEVTFEAEHSALFGGLAYSCEFPNGLTLDGLEELCFELWDGTPVAHGGRGTENQPIVAGKSLVERSMGLLGGE